MRTRRNLLFLWAWWGILMACSGQEKTADGLLDHPSFNSDSPVVLHSVFQSNMVLQREADVPFRGTGGIPGQSIRVICSWQNKPEGQETVIDKNGEWEIPVHTPEAGGPYEVVVQGKNRVVLSNVMIGDVWLCAGQSNMQMQVNEVDRAAAEIAGSENPAIRLFNIRKRVQSDTPVDKINAVWEVCQPSTIPAFSAVAYFFGRKLQTTLGIPIGLINSSWGSTPAEVWTRRGVVLADPLLAKDAAFLENAGGSSPYRAGNVYNAMIYPFRRFPIAGVIWYQGENNQTTAGNYEKLLMALIQDWRKEWGIEFPFYIAQICPRYRQWDYRTMYANPNLRYRQMLVAEYVGNSGIEVNDDITELDNTHPGNKQEVGGRLADLALAKHYRQEAFSKFLCPVFDKMETGNGELRVYFKYAPEGLKTSDDRSPRYFEIAGVDRDFKAAEAVIEGNCVVLRSPEVVDPRYARLGWSYYKVTNLCSQPGLPVSIFKTYDWPEDIEEPNP